jgi:hypothetical protein
MVENAYVKLYKIELRKKWLEEKDEEDESDGDINGDDTGNPYLSVMEGEKKFNLVNLRNGVTEELALVEIPAGTYDLVRMYMRDGTIELQGGGIYDLKIPSGSSSGLKIFVDPAITVQGGITAELLLDINLNRSLVMKGNIQDIRGFNFSPVVRAVNASIAGRIEGYVTNQDQEFIKNANVWIEDSEGQVASTVTEETGYYALIGIPAGTYVLKVEKVDYVTFEMANVEVNAANKTLVDVELSVSSD